MISLINAFFLLSAQGGTAPALWTTAEGNRVGLLGTQIERAGDLNADGVPDLIVSNQIQGYGYGGSAVAAISGLDGTTLFVWRVSDEPGRTEGFGIWVGGADDFDLDGHDDVFIVDDERFISQGITGSLQVFSGRDGSEIFRLDSTLDNEIRGGALVGDLDGDGRQDLVVADSAGVGTNGIYRPGVIRAHACGSGALIYRVEGTVRNGEFGSSLAATEDMNDDGVPDFFVGAQNVEQSGSYSRGAVYALSGVNGAIIRTFRNTTSVTGVEIASAGDLDGDGVPDLLSGQPLGWGIVFCFSGATGAILFRLDGAYQEEYGWRLSGGQDYDGDGVSDFTVCARQWASTPFGTEGAVFVYNASGAEIARMTGVSIYDYFGSDGLLVGDMNGDGRSEIAVGIPYRDSATVQNAGAVEIYGAETWLNLRPPHWVAGQASLSQLEVVMPPAAAGWRYLLLVSAGPPGSFVRGVEIPLTPDPLLWAFLARNYPAGLVHAGLSGVLDADGSASGFLAVPSQLTSALAGRSLRFAAIAAPPGSGVPAISSSAIELRILP